MQVPQNYIFCQRLTHRTVPLFFPFLHSPSTHCLMNFHNLMYQITFSKTELLTGVVVKQLGCPEKVGHRCSLCAVVSLHKAASHSCVAHSSSTMQPVDNRL